jgi:hypothetical protein
MRLQCWLGAVRWEFKLSLQTAEKIANMMTRGRCSVYYGLAYVRCTACREREREREYSCRFYLIAR